MRITQNTSSLILIFILQLTTTIFGQECKAIEEEPWSYLGKTNGPSQWSKNFPTCGGTSQSPIMLQSDEAQSSDQDPLTMVGYDTPLTEAEFCNNGYTVQVTPKDDQERYIEIDGTQYNLVEFHFHWSEREYDGAEHAVDYDYYDMEAHFVHQNGDGDFAIIGVLYESTGKSSAILDPIVNNLAKIQYKDQMTTFQGEINLNDFLPSDRAYFSYSGSLTIPPCTEGVNWSVFKSIPKIGKDQVKQFTKLYAVTEDNADEGCRITENARPIQELNGRTVFMCSI